MKIVLSIVFVLLLLNIKAQTPYQIKEQYDNLQNSIANKNRYLQETEPYYNDVHLWSSKQLGDGMSKVILSYITMYKATGDKAYLIKFINESIKIQAWRYDVQNQGGSNSFPKWTLNSIEDPTESTYLNALIILPMAQFVYLVKQDETLYNTNIPQSLISLISYDMLNVSTSDIITYGTYAEWLSTRVEETIDYLNANRWCDDFGFMKIKMEHCEGWHPFEPNKPEDYVTEVNMQAPYGMALLYMALANNNSNYLAKAEILYNKYMGNRRYQTKNWLKVCTKWVDTPVLELQDNNSYTFRHSAFKYEKECDSISSYEDMGHGVWSLLFPLRAYELAGFFTEQEMIRFRNTFVKNIWDADLQGFHVSVYGTDDNCDLEDISFNHYEFSSMAYSPFAKFDDNNDDVADVYDIVMDFYEREMLDIGISGINEHVFGQGIYGLSELVNTQWSKECYNLTLRNRKLVYDQDFIAKNELIIDPSLPNAIFPNDHSAFADPTDFTADEFLITSGITVNFIAGKRIVVKSGSSLQYGANFHAYIDPSLCGNQKSFLSINSNSSSSVSQTYGLFADNDNQVFIST